MESYLIFSLCIIILLTLCIYPKYKNKNKINIESFSNNLKQIEAKNIIAFSLWGNNECYNWGAVENALLAKELYPDWICRFYVSKDIIPDVRKKLEELENVEVVEKPNLGVTNAFYRFIPMFEEDCEAVLSRDTDSRLNHREKEAVKLWLAQDKELLILRNNKYHNQLIMAGMFGVKNNVFHKHKKSVLCCKSYDLFLFIPLGSLYYPIRNESLCSNTQILVNICKNLESLIFSTAFICQVVQVV